MWKGWYRPHVAAQAAAGRRTGRQQWQQQQQQRAQWVALTAAGASRWPLVAYGADAWTPTAASHSPACTAAAAGACAPRRSSIGGRLCVVVSGLAAATFRPLVCARRILCERHELHVGDKCLRADVIALGMPGAGSGSSRGGGRRGSAHCLCVGIGRGCSGTAGLSAAGATGRGVSGSPCGLCSRCHLCPQMCSAGGRQDQPPRSPCTALFAAGAAAACGCAGSAGLGGGDVWGCDGGVSLSG